MLKKGNKMKKFILLLLTLTITLSLVPLNFVSADDSVSINSIKSVYQLDSKIIGYPTVTTFIDDGGDLDKLVVAKKLPAMAFLRLTSGAELNVVDKNGEVISPLYYVLQNVFKDKIIPAFYVEDVETATALADFIVEYDILDCTVVSPSGEILSSVLYYEDNGGFVRRRQVGGMLEVNDAQNYSPIELSKMANTFGARNVLVDIDDFNKDVLKNLNTEYKVNFMTMYLKTSGELGAYRAIECGADAIVTPDWDLTIDVFESFKENTLIKPIVVQAHRGMDAVYNENTLESIYASALVGVNSIEIDPRLTKDLKIVLVHDADLGRITGYRVNGKVSDYTLSQLKAMDVIVNESAQPSKICTLEEVFELYKTYNLTTKLALDAKETNTQYIDVLYNLIEEYNMWEYISSVGVADSSQKSLYIEKFAGKIPFELVGATTVGGGKTNVETLTKNWLSVANGSYSAVGTLAPYYDYLVPVSNSVAFPELSRIMKDRGIKLAPYQFDTVEDIEKAFLLDFASISTGYSIYLKDFLNTVDTKNLSLNIGDTINLNCTNYYVDGTSKLVVADGFVIVDGIDVLTTDGANLTAKKQGNAKVMAYTTFIKGNLTYRVYSDILSVSVEKDAVRSDNVILKSTEVPKNNDNTLAIILISIACVVVIAGTVTTCLILRRRKNGKN